MCTIKLHASVQQIKCSVLLCQSPSFKLTGFSSNLSKPKKCCYSTFDFSHVFRQMVPPSALINISLLKTLVMTAYHHTVHMPDLHWSWLLLEP